MTIFGVPDVVELMRKLHAYVERRHCNEYDTRVGQSSNIFIIACYRGNRLKRTSFTTSFVDQTIPPYCIGMVISLENGTGNQCCPFHGPFQARGTNMS